MRVLLVEDNNLDAELISHYLKGTNVQLERVSFLSEALNKRNSIYDTILLDLKLPNSIGVETVTKMFKFFPDTPITIITGDNSRDTIEKAHQEGAQDYIPKHKLTKERLSASLRNTFDMVLVWRTVKKLKKILSYGLK